MQLLGVLLHAHVLSCVTQLSLHVRSWRFRKKVAGTVLKRRFANLNIQGASLVMLKYPLRVTHTVTIAYYRGKP